MVSENFENFDPSQYAQQDIKSSRLSEAEKFRLENEYKQKLKPETPKQKRRLSKFEQRKLIEKIKGKLEKEDKAEKESRKLNYSKLKKIFKKVDSKRAVKRRAEGTKRVLSAMGVIPTQTKTPQRLTQAYLNKLIYLRNKQLQQPRKIIIQGIPRNRTRQEIEQTLYNRYLQLRKDRESRDNFEQDLESVSYQKLRDRLIFVQSKCRRDNLRHKRRIAESRSLGMAQNLMMAHKNMLSPQENAINFIDTENNILTPKINIMQDSEGSIHILRPRGFNILQTSQAGNTLQF